MKGISMSPHSPVSLLFAATLAVSPLLLPGPALGDEAHVALQGYRGHAAALGEPGDPAAPARTVAMTMTDDMRFTPAAISVRRGETIRFVVRNAGEVRHELTLGTKAELRAHARAMEKFPEMEHDDPNAATVEPGESKTVLWRFTKAGVFDFACLQPGHMQAGMTGRVTVR
jgi:uncharacterized cupredoxin-like copper-binding protein